LKFGGLIEGSWREILGVEPEGIRGEDTIFLEKFRGDFLNGDFLKFWAKI